MSPSGGGSSEFNGTPHGWRVFVCSVDAITDKSGVKPKRFGPEKTLMELGLYRDEFKVETRQLRRELAARWKDTAIANDGSIYPP